MRVLLINPPIKNAVKSELPSWINQTTGVFPPLGLMYISSYLKLYTDNQIKILDAVAEDMPYGAIESFIGDFEPQLIGITAFTHNLIDAILVAKISKKIVPKAHICLGGVHASAFPKQAINIPEVDSVVAGEGEAIFTELACCLEDGKDLQRIKGLLLKLNGQVLYTEASGIMPNLNVLPFPDRCAVDNSKYYHIASKKLYVATMVSSRGCPYQCSFCSTFHGLYRMRTPENIVDEMVECSNLGLDEIYFLDDTFNVHLERVFGICDEILKRKLKIKWSFKGRIDKITRELLEKVKKSGCVRINFGIETSTDEALAVLNKQITVKQIKEVFRWTKKIGIDTVAYFMIGCPHERNHSDVMKTVDFACELNPNFALFNILTLYPSTKLYELALEKGIIKGENWDDFVNNPSTSFTPPVWQEYLSSRELLKLLEDSYRRFYLRPGVILNNLFNLADIQSLGRKIKVCASILKGDK